MKIADTAVADEFSAAAIGRRLRLIREAKGYTQPFIAQLCGMSAQAWNNNECGRDRMSIVPALALCNAIPGVGLNWIYRGIVTDLPADLAQAVTRAQRGSPNPPSRPSRVKSRKQARSASRAPALSR